MVELGDKKKHAHTLLPSEPALRVKAIETLLVEKGLIDPAAIDAMVEAFESRIGPKNGARVVAKAWKNPEYKARLLLDASGAIAELGYSGLQGEHMVAIENTESVHNLVVCTLCSCYPWPVLGVPPAWYKSPAYRARAVRDPRGVLAEFGVNLAMDTDIRSGIQLPKFVILLFRSDLKEARAIQRRPLHLLLRVIRWSGLVSLPFLKSKKVKGYGWNS